MTEATFGGLDAIVGDQNHPLQAVRRTGTVTAVTNVPLTVTVAIGGDTTNPVEVPYLSSYVPLVNDVVVILAARGDNIIVGSLNNLLAAPEGRYSKFWSIPLTTIATNTNVTLNTASFVLVTGGGGYGGSLPPINDFAGISSGNEMSTGNWICPASGVYTFSYAANIDTAINARMWIGMYFNPATGGSGFGRVYGLEDSQQSVTGLKSLTMAYPCAVGDQVAFHIFQNSGAIQNLNAGPQISWVFIKRLHD